MIKATLNSLLAISSCLLIAACGSDTTVQDYNREQVNDEFARVQSSDGLYRGPLISRQGGTNYGDLNFEMQADTKLTSTDNYVPNRQTVIKGRLTNGNKYISFDEGYLVTKGGLIQATISVEREDKSIGKLELRATLTGNQIRGSIEVNGQAPYGATFVLERQEAGAKPEAASSQRSLTLRRWNNVGVPGADLMPISLNLTELASTSDQDFFNLLMPIKLVKATLLFGSDNPTVFQNAEWDLRNNHLHGSVTSASADGLFGDLDCYGDAEQAWSCDYLSQRLGRTRHIRLVPNRDATP